MIWKTLNANSQKCRKSKLVVKTHAYVFESLPHQTLCLLTNKSQITKTTESYDTGVTEATLSYKSLTSPRTQILREQGWLAAICKGACWRKTVVALYNDARRFRGASKLKECIKFHLAQAKTSYCTCGAVKQNYVKNGGWRGFDTGTWMMGRVGLHLEQRKTLLMLGSIGFEPLTMSAGTLHSKRCNHYIFPVLTQTQTDQHNCVYM